MKKLKGAIAALLSLVLLAGCGGADTSTQGGLASNDVPARNVDIEYGRYVETDITPPGMVGDITALYAKDNRIDLITQDNNFSEEGGTYFYETTMYRYRSEDGGATWQEVDMSWAEPYKQSSERSQAYFDLVENAEEGEELEPFYTLGWNISIAATGEVIATLESYSNDGMSSSTQIIRVKNDGEVEFIEIPQLQDALDEDDGSGDVMVYMGSLEMLTDELFYVETSKSIRIDENSYMGTNEGFKGVVNLETGELAYELTDWDGWGIATNGQVMYLYSSTSGDYEAYDLQNGQKRGDLPSYSWEQLNKLSPGSTYANNYMMDDENRFYSLNAYGLFRIGAEDEEAEKLMDGLNYTFGSPLAAISSYYRLTQDSYIALLRDDDYNVNQMLRYDYDPEAPANSGKLLKVFAMYDSNVARMAVSEFSIAHPEISIEYTFMLDRYERGYYDEEDDVLTEEDIMRQLNLDILNGNGPDVVILDDLPLQSYIDQGILVDLSGLAAELDVIDEVVNPLYTEKGELFAMPSQFSMPLLFGEPELVGQVSTLDSLLAAVASDEVEKPAEKEWDWDNMTDDDWREYWNEMDRPLSADERPLFGANYINEIVDMLYDTSAPAIYTEKTGIDKDGVTAFLEAVKVFSDAYDLEYSDWYSGWNGWSSNGGLVRYRSMWGMDAYTQMKASLGYESIEHFNVLTDMMSNNQSRRYDWGNWDEETGMPIVLENPEVLAPQVVLMPGMVEGAYYPKVMAGVLANSPEKEAAFEFIRTLMSEGVQKRELAEGLPATWSGLQIQVQRYQDTEMSHYGYGNDNFEPIIEVDFEGLISQLKQPVYANSYLKDIISEHAAAYCDGSKTLEQAVNDIMSESAIYFAERQS